MCVCKCDVVSSILRLADTFWKASDIFISRRMEEEEEDETLGGKVGVSGGCKVG